MRVKRGLTRTGLLPALFLGAFALAAWWLARAFPWPGLDPRQPASSGLEARRAGPASPGTASPEDPSEQRSVPAVAGPLPSATVKNDVQEFARQMMHASNIGQACLAGTVIYNVLVRKDLRSSPFSSNL